ncbi:MAG: methyltransferase family protein [Thermoanaerobaculia bacterium]
MRFFPPPVLFMVCFAAAALLERLRPLALPPLDHRAALVTGTVMLVIAAFLGYSAIYVMWRAKTPIEPGHVPSKLVTTGPFRFTRNPLYVTLLLIMIAVGFMMSSAWFLITAAMLLVLLDRLIIAREERVIRQHFGDEYAAYMARVRRWV